MAIHFANKKAKEAWYGGKRIKEAWYGGKRVWPPAVPIGTVVTRSLWPTIYGPGELEAPPRGVWRIELKIPTRWAGTNQAQYPVDIIIGGTTRKLYVGQSLEVTFVNDTPFSYRYVSGATLQLTKIRHV